MKIKLVRWYNNSEIDNGIIARIHRHTDADPWVEPGEEGVLEVTNIGWVSEYSCVGFVPAVGDKVSMFVFSPDDRKIYTGWVIVPFCDKTEIEIDESQLTAFLNEAPSAS